MLSRSSLALDVHGCFRPVSRFGTCCPTLQIAAPRLRPGGANVLWPVSCRGAPPGWEEDGRLLLVNTPFAYLRPNGLCGMCESRIGSVVIPG